MLKSVAFLIVIIAVVRISALKPLIYKKQKVGTAGLCAAAAAVVAPLKNHVETDYVDLAFAEDVVYGLGVCVNDFPAGHQVCVGGHNRFTLTFKDKAGTETSLLAAFGARNAKENKACAFFSPVDIANHFAAIEVEKARVKAGAVIFAETAAASGVAIPITVSFRTVVYIIDYGRELDIQKDYGYHVIVARGSLFVLAENPVANPVTITQHRFLDAAGKFAPVFNRAGPEIDGVLHVIIVVCGAVCPDKLKVFVANVKFYKPGAATNLKVSSAFHLLSVAGIIAVTV